MLIQGSEKEKFLACLYNREIQKLDGSKPPVKKICIEFLDKYPGPSINTVIGDLTNLRKRKYENGFIILKDAIPNFSEIDNVDNYVSPIDNKKLKIDQSTINEKLPNPPKLTVGNCENEKIYVGCSGWKTNYYRVRKWRYSNHLAIAPSNIETKEFVGCRGSEVGAGSSGDADGTNLYSPKVMPKVKLEEELPNFDDEESLTSASGLAKTGSNNCSGTQKNPFSLSSECSSENTIIQDNPTNLFHKLVKINSYYNKGNVGRKFYLIFPKLYHIKLVSVEDNKDNHSIRFQFKNNLTREDIESGIGDVVDHRLAKQFQEEVSDLVVEYKYPVNFNISDVNEIRAPKVVGAEVFYVDYTTLRYK
ncbi:hypothetical protein ACTFIY_008114 [Dictyostelium cf. discoideum]